MRRRCRSRRQPIPSRHLTVNFRVTAKDAITAEIESELRKTRDLVEGIAHRHKDDARSRDDLGTIWCALGIIAELGVYAAALLGDREW
jgi:hypothetical protein